MSLTEGLVDIDTDNQTVRSAVERYLDRLGCTLWRDWDIKNADSREKALDWACDFFEDIALEVAT